MTAPPPPASDELPNPPFRQAIRRWGNSLAVRLPADCLRQAGLEEGDSLAITVEDGHLRLEPTPRHDRSALVADLRRLQASLPPTPAVIEACRDGERW